MGLGFYVDMGDIFEWELMLLVELHHTLDISIFSEGVDFWVWINDSYRAFI